ncbi:MAG: SusC/RagA family TonB-linked outer membrane protein [Candidatus Cyclobacteriaceae bacterium M3_2C_046]
MASKSLFYGIMVQCFLYSMLWAADGNAQSERLDQTIIRISQKDFTIRQLLDEVENSTSFHFVYPQELINDEVLSLDSTGKLALSDLLMQVSRKTNLKFKQVNNTIYLGRKQSSINEMINLSTGSRFQTRTITGKVTSNEDGNGLPGVNIVEKGTSNGTVTDVQGNYRIEVSDGATLVFSSVGYVSQEVEIGNRSVIDLTMSIDVTQLQELVVVGYGTQKKSDVTGAIGVVDGDELLKAPINNVLQGLEGRVAGVNVFLNSGSPTSSPRILIRGLGTINANSSPLYVVDGVVMEDIQFLNPNDIKSMEVLKDASSTAIYGSRGANGVILITTKRGSEKEGINISYDGFMSLGTLRKKMDLLNAQEWLEVVRTGMENTPKYRPSSNPVFTTNDPNLFDANGNPLYDTDWQEEATRTAVSHNHQLSIQQKNQNSSYGAFLNYSRMEGIMLNNYLDRVYGKIAYEGTPKNWLTVGFNLLANYTKENEFEEGGGHQMPRRTMIEMPPIFPIKFPDGTWSNSQMIEDAYNLEAMANPVHVLETQDRLRTRTQLFGNAYLVFHLAEGLDLRTQLGFDKHDRHFQDYSPTDLINISDPLGRATQSYTRTLYWQQETFLNYTKEIGDHSINSVLGLSWQERTSDYFGVTTRGFSDDFFRFNRLQAASQPDTPGSSYDEWSLNSYFLRGGYTYLNRYMITLTGRIDGSSRFGSNNKYGFFPSIGAGWLISEEPFMSGNNIFDQLKLRTSYGVTGNTEIPIYQSLATVSSGTTLLNGSRVTDSYVNRLANPNLEWEKTKQFDVGFNMAFLDYRLNLEFDYYYKLTTDLLLDRPIPQTTGFGAVRDNIGSVSNEGLEFLITSMNVDKPNFNWETTLNFNYNRNTIEKLGENNEDIFPGPWWVSGSQTILRVGEPLSSYWGYKRYGTWNLNEADEAEKVGDVPGEAKRSEQPMIIGNGLPVWTGSFINSLQIGNFDFNLDLQFVYDVDILQQFYHSTEDRSGIANGLRTILTEGWTEQNQNTMVQEIRNQAYAGQNSEIDSRWVADGSYLRFNMIQMGYSFDPKLVSKWNMQKLRLYFNVQNAFVIHSSEFQGLDPEATSWGGNQWGQNIFFFQYPRPRTFTIGASVQF